MANVLLRESIERVLLVLTRESIVGRERVKSGAGLRVAEDDCRLGKWFMLIFYVHEKNDHSHVLIAKLPLPLQLTHDTDTVVFKELAVCFRRRRP